jgi:hypothetical protein
VGEAVGFEALHAAAFVVHGNQHIGAGFFDLAAQLGELFATFKVARKQDQAAGQRVFQALFVGFAEGGAGNVEHHRGGMKGHACLRLCAGV